MVLYPGPTVETSFTTLSTNHPPTVSASANPTTVTEGGTVTLTGTAADTDTGDTLTYAWTSGGGGTFSRTSALSPTWLAPGVSSSTDVTLTLTVNDGRASVTATATVTVDPLPECTAVLLPAVDLGALGSAAGSVLPSAAGYAGSLNGDVTTAICTDGGYATQYFGFTLAEGGGVRLTAESNGHAVGHLTPEVLLLPAIGDTPTFANGEADDNLGQLSMVLDAGSYIAQVRATEGIITGSDAGGGDYRFTARRIHPVQKALSFTGDQLKVIYGVSTSAPNMTLVVEYKKAAASSWATAGPDAEYSNADGSSLVEVVQTGLMTNTGYDLRARYKYASSDVQYTLSSGSTTSNSRLAAPTRPNLGTPEYNAEGDPFSVLIVASWNYPQLILEDGSGSADWGFEVDWGEFVTFGGQSHQTSNQFTEDDVGKRLTVRVRAKIDCVDDDDKIDEPCALFVRGLTSFSDDDDRIPIAEGDVFYSAWSDNNVFVLTDAHDEIPTMIEDLDPEAFAPIVDAIDGVLAGMGVSRQSRRPETWAFFLCGIMAVGGGLGLFYATGGTKNFFWCACAGCFVFFMIWTFAGPSLFGVPPVFAYSTVMLPLFLGAVAVVKGLKV